MSRFMKLAVVFRDHEVKSLVFGPLDADEEDVYDFSELENISRIEQRMQSLVDRVNRLSGLLPHASSYDRFIVTWKNLDAYDDRVTSPVRSENIMIEEYFSRLEECLFNYEPSSLPPIDFDRGGSFFQKLKKGFNSFGRFLDDMGREMAKNPSSHLWS